MSDQKYIGVIGAGECGPELYELAREVGRRIAEAGGVVVCGGLGGVMEAACRGAKEAGGETIGILPVDFREAANKYVDIVLPTGMGEGRNFLIVRASQALIAVGGEYGTLSEIALGLKLGKKVVGLSTWQLQKPGIVEAGSAEAAVQLALEAAVNS